MVENDTKQVNQMADTSKETIQALMNDLGSQDGQVRVRARSALVAIGSPAVEPLVKALANKREWCRWEAAKALSQIANPMAAQALINALEDKMFDVRWLAAEGLISIGRESIIPLLLKTMEHPDSLVLREGAHHVLHDMYKGDLTEILRPVIRALEGLEPSVEVPVAADKALKTLTYNAGGMGIYE